MFRLKIPALVATDSDGDVPTSHQKTHTTSQLRDVETQSPAVVTEDPASSPVTPPTPSTSRHESQVINVQCEHDMMCFVGMSVACDTYNRQCVVHKL